MTYLLSIVIVNFNTGRYIADCIKSIQKTTSNLSTPKIELIVIDNASTDSSMAAIGNFQSRSDKLRLFPISNFQLIRNKKNVGFAKAVNQGIKAAHGKCILLLNPDTKVRPGAIDGMVVFVQQTPDAGVVGARLLNPDGTIQTSVVPLPTLWRAIQEFWLGKKGVYLKYAPATLEPIIVEAVVGAAFLITPQAREKVGMMDERFWMYFEDLDYCRRVKNAGLKVYYLPASQIIHYHGISGQNVKGEKDQWKRLVPSSRIYHGLIGHYFINFVLWSGQKVKNLL